MVKFATVCEIRRQRKCSHLYLNYKGNYYKTHTLLTILALLGVYFPVLVGC